MASSNLAIVSARGEGDEQPVLGAERGGELVAGQVGLDVVRSEADAAMTLVRLEDLGRDVLEQLAQITLPAAREHAPEWLPDLDAARQEIAEALAPGKIARVLLDASGRPVGWVAAAHAWGRLWELHPLIVAIEHQRCGHGRRLVREIERIAAAQGALTMTLSTSDTVGATSLGGVDLYDGTFARLANIEVLRPHAIEFWRRMGYQIVGVLPDAEGPGKPSIHLARRL